MRFCSAQLSAHFIISHKEDEPIDKIVSALLTLAYTGG